MKWRTKKGHVYLTGFMDLERAKVVHVVKLLNDVLDSIRRREHKENIPRFNKIRYLLLKDPKKLKKSQRERLDEFLTQANLDTVKAYNLIQMFKRGYEYQKPSWAGKFFHHWIKLCQQSKIPEMLKGAQAILTHLKGIMAYFTYRVTNAVMEGNNSKLRTITKRSYGFKTLRYLRLMIFLVFGKLKFDVPRLA